MIIIASACRSASNRATTCLVSHAEFDDFECHSPAHWLFLFSHVNHAATAFAEFFAKFVTTDRGADDFVSNRKLKAMVDCAWAGEGSASTESALSWAARSASRRLRRGFVSGAGLVEIGSAGWAIQENRGLEKGFLALGRRAHARIVRAHLLRSSAIGGEKVCGNCEISYGSASIRTVRSGGLSDRCI